MDNWMAIYLHQCLEYIKENYPVAYYECGAQDFEVEYTEYVNEFQNSKESSKE